MSMARHNSLADRCAVCHLDDRPVTFQTVHLETLTRRTEHGTLEEGWGSGI